eukprot:1160118-Pelagomonas_calceolata.AAC.18
MQRNSSQERNWIKQSICSTAAGLSRQFCSLLLRIGGIAEGAVWKGKRDQGIEQRGRLHSSHKKKLCRQRKLSLHQFRKKEAHWLRRTVKTQGRDSLHTLQGLGSLHNPQGSLV